MFHRTLTAAALLGLLAGCSVDPAEKAQSAGTVAPPTPPESDNPPPEIRRVPRFEPVPPPPPARTIVKDVRALERLRGNSGLTLQWISWDHRGQVNVREVGEMIYLNGEQRARDGSSAIVSLSGGVSEIGKDYFILQGSLTIQNTPDEGRDCELAGPMEFRVTQNRKYWRLRKFEWCDDLTDYVDIYF